MDPLTGALLGKGIDAAALVGGKFLGGLAAQPPNLSSATQINTMSAPFNVGGAAVASGSVTGVLTTYAPLVVVAVVLWLAFR